MSGRGYLSESSSVFRKNTVYYNRLTEQGVYHEGDSTGQQSALGYGGAGVLEVTRYISTSCPERER